ncbi:MAG: co-chaperone GroES [Helicobacteraceae bacterium]|jgi:chaperonin GroES|nr:co-chaperone GroES [Helicobacteraceae bacterium]
MLFTPLGYRILVERSEEPTKTASGIIIPDNAKEKPLDGKVVAISKAIKEKGEIAVGDVVVFGKYAGTEIKIDGKDYVVLNNSEKNDDVLGVRK